MNNLLHPEFLTVDEENAYEEFKAKLRYNLVHLDHTEEQCLDLMRSEYAAAKADPSHPYRLVDEALRKKLDHLKFQLILH